MSDRVVIHPHFHLVLTGGLVEGGCDRGYVAFGGFSVGLAADDGDPFGGGLGLKGLVIFWSTAMMSILQMRVWPILMTRPPACRAAWALLGKSRKTRLEPLSWRLMAMTEMRRVIAVVIGGNLLQLNILLSLHPSFFKCNKLFHPLTMMDIDDKNQRLNLSGRVLSANWNKTRARLRRFLNETAIPLHPVEHLDKVTIFIAGIFKFLGLVTRNCDLDPVFITEDNNCLLLAGEQNVQRATLR